MASTYPTTLDTTSTFPTDVTNDTDSQAGTPRTGTKGFLAQLLDDQNDAIVKIETELGALPKGASASVAARLDEGERKQAARGASTATISINPGGTSFIVDGITYVNGDRILLKDQSTPATNGVYVVGGVGSSVTLTRSADMDTAADVADVVISVQQGTLHGDSQWRQVTSAPITLGTTALRWTRTFPDYQPFARNPWAPGATPPLLVNMDRDAVVTSNAQTAITATSSFHGGMILRAGTTYTSINSFCTAVGAGAVTLNHYSLVRQSDRTSLRSTANSTALPGLGVYTRALATTLTVDVDTPCWVMWSTQVATTSPAFAGSAALTALVQPFAVTTPIFHGNSTTVPTSTPPVNGAVQGAPTTATNARVYFWLT